MHGRFGVGFTRCNKKNSYLFGPFAYVIAMNQVSKETGLFIACVAGTAAAQTCGAQALNSGWCGSTANLKDPGNWAALLFVTTAADLLLAVPLVAAAEVYERNRRRP